MPRARRGGQAWIPSASIVTVTGYGLALGWLEPEPLARGEIHVRIILTLGYGHLLASIVRSRAGQPATSAWRAVASIAPLVAAYVLYAELCRMWPLLPLALLGVSAWHTVENDRAIRRMRLDGTAPIAPLSTSPREVAGDVLAAIAISILALALPRWLPMIDTADVVAAFSLHHVATWLVLVVARARARGQLRAAAVRLVWLHLPMGALCVASMIALAMPSALPPAITSGAEVVLSPATYLFWSAAHVVHTAWRRWAR